MVLLEKSFLYFNVTGPSHFHDFSPGQRGVVLFELRYLATDPSDILIIRLRFGFKSFQITNTSNDVFPNNYLVRFQSFQGHRAHRQLPRLGGRVHEALRSLSGRSKLLNRISMKWIITVKAKTTLETFSLEKRTFEILLPPKPNLPTPASLSVLG